MKSITSQIFKEVYGYTEEAQLNDRAITEEVNCMIELLENDLQIDKVGEYMFNASGYGQQMGFIGGFKFAIQLMCECYSL